MSECWRHSDRFPKEIGKAVRILAAFRQIPGGNVKICPNSTAIQTDLQVKGLNLSESGASSDRIANQKSESVRKQPSFRQNPKPKE
ncbi:hypothetical protein [Bacillus sp. B15-48]|uniref:hypothetical protein n=1 Tax=Bacillus sp. B15-48 TaxID=1548601 RepID=UPI00193FEE0D|nr:hypothetical protein [Bacillus sp. B15-48]MBM4764458.1 hypothetical protein [Bacillus sp. B15-48]